MAVYKEVFDIYKLISLQVHTTLLPSTWEALLLVLLEIENTLLNSATKTTIVANLSSAEACADMILETLLYTWVRAPVISDALWTLLRRQLNKATVWNQTIWQWASIMTKLTKLESLKIYDVDLDAVKSPNSRSKKIFMSSLSKILFDSEENVPESNDTVTFEGSIFPKEELEKEKVDFQNYRERKMSHHNSEISNEPPVELLRTTSISITFVLHRKISEFGNLNQVTTLDSTNIHSFWKNFLCSIGNPNDILSPSNHARGIKGLVGIWDSLERIRTLQPYTGVVMPPLFDFASWIFQAADLCADYSDGRAIAYGCMCRMMCRRHDQPIPEDLIPHFYRLLIKGLLSTDLKVNYAIIMNAGNLFNLPLAGCYIIIPTLISSIEEKVFLIFPLLIFSF